MMDRSEELRREYNPGGGWAGAGFTRTIGAHCTMLWKRQDHMPIYEYRPSGNMHCDVCRNGFEVIQKIEDARLKQCPECKAPVERQISAATIGKPGPGLDQSTLEKHGFTQYKRAGKGVYEKTAGKGPRVITDD